MTYVDMYVDMYVDIRNGLNLENQSTNKSVDPYEKIAQQIIFGNFGSL